MASTTSPGPGRGSGNSLSSSSRSPRKTTPRMALGVSLLRRAGRAAAAARRPAGRGRSPGRRCRRRRARGRSTGARRAGPGASGVSSAAPTSAERRIRTGSHSHRTRAATTMPAANTAGPEPRPVEPEGGRDGEAAVDPDGEPAQRRRPATGSTIASTAPTIPRTSAATTTSHSGPSGSAVGATWSPTAKPAAPTKSQKSRRPNRRTASPTTRVTHQLAMGASVLRARGARHLGSGRRQGTTRVPARPSSAARMAGSEVMIASRPPASTNSTAASILGPIEPGGNSRAVEERARLREREALDPDRARPCGARPRPGRRR